ncbi:MAG: PilZ domain-containing protein [Deltaproteobacteria bacterium]
MAAKKEDTIQFEDLDLAELKDSLSQNASNMQASREEVVRHSFRVPFAKEDAAYAEIAGKSYHVANISNRGLSIRLPGNSGFVQGEELPKIIFSVEGRKTVLKGNVVHISIEDENQYLCGISLTEMSEEQERYFMELVQQQRLAMFSKE